MNRNANPGTRIYLHPNGDSITVEKKHVAKAEWDYLENVERAAADATVDETEINEMIWSPENPLVELHPVTGKPYIERDGFDHPVFQAMQYLVDEKRIKLGTLDLEAAAARYTMTVKEAADKLGIHTASVRKAILAKRLAAWKKGGSYMLDPASVESYSISTRGARADVQFSKQAHGELLPGLLAIRAGTDGDYFLRLKSSASENPSEEFKEGDAIRQITIGPRWKQVAVQTGKKSANSYRLFILEPRMEDAIQETGLSFAGFYVRGNFNVVKKINNAKDALAAWKAYEPPALY